MRHGRGGQAASPLVDSRPTVKTSMSPATHLSVRGLSAHVHLRFRPRRSALLLALLFAQNESNLHRKRDGQGYRLMTGSSCDVDSQQLMPGGVAILFAWGHPSANVLKKGELALGRTRWTEGSIRGFC